MTINYTEPRLVFFHIPKAAGTSIIQTLYDALGDEQVYWMGHNNNPAEFLHATDWDQFEGYRVFAGHFQLIHAERMPFPKIYFSTVRHPIDRAFSLFNYISRTNKNHRLHDALKGKTVVEAIKLNIDFKHEVNNRQCKILSNHTDVNSTIRSIMSNLLMVETHENAQRLLNTMCEHLGIDRRHLRRDNVGKANYKKDLTDETTVNFLEALNTEDKILYDTLRSDG